MKEIKIKCFVQIKSYMKNMCHLPLSLRLNCQFSFSDVITVQWKNRTLVVPNLFLPKFGKLLKKHLAADFKKVYWLGAIVREPLAGLEQGI